MLDLMKHTRYVIFGQTGVCKMLILIRVVLFLVKQESLFLD